MTFLSSSRSHERRVAALAGRAESGEESPHSKGAVAFALCLLFSISGAQAAERLTVPEAEKLIDAHIRAATPTMNPAAKFPVKELTTDEVWKRMSVQVFQVTGGVRECETFLVRGGKEVRPLGIGFGGSGVMSLCIADLDRDGKPELVYTYSWGSGDHRSHAAVYREKDGKVQEAVVPFAFKGDMFASSFPDGSVEVEIGRYRQQVNRWIKTGRLGKLSISEKDGKLQADVAIRANLPDEMRKDIWKTTLPAR
jgi:hypothetical protein